MVASAILILWWKYTTLVAVLIIFFRKYLKTIKRVGIATKGMFMNNKMKNNGYVDKTT